MVAAVCGAGMVMDDRLIDLVIWMGRGMNESSGKRGPKRAVVAMTGR